MPAVCGEAVFGAEFVAGAAEAGAGVDGRFAVTDAAVVEVREIVGLVRGGARGAALAADSSLGADDGLVSATGATLSAGSGGASFSNSRAVAGAVAGLRPVGLPLRLRRLIRGLGAAGWSKFSSVGAVPESGWAAGEVLSGMSVIEITPWVGNSRHKPVWRKDFPRILLQVFM